MLLHIILAMHVYTCMLYYICVYIVCRSSILSEPVPNILVQLITGFETFLKNQKAESDLISKYSDTSMKKVKQDTTTQSQVQLS
jgi:hypothetical protein